jgi:hypothetical protein
VKGSPQWKATRKDYLIRLQHRLDADPEFAVLFRAEAAARTRQWNARLREADPERHAAMKAEKRAERAAWRKTLESDPAAWEAHKAACRAWYAGLSDLERDRIFNIPRRKHPGGPRTNWPASVIRLLGVVQDKEIAGMMKVHPITVALKRQELGIPALDHRRRHVVASMLETRSKAGMLANLNSIIEQIAHTEGSSPDDVLDLLLRQEGV